MAHLLMQVPVAHLLMQVPVAHLLMQVPVAHLLMEVVLSLHVKVPASLFFYRFNAGQSVHSSTPPATDQQQTPANNEGPLICQEPTDPNQSVEPNVCQ